MPPRTAIYARTPGTFHAADLQNLSGFDGNGCPIGNGRAVECRGEFRTGEADDGVGVEFERRPGECRLDPGGAFIVADDPVGQTER